VSRQAFTTAADLQRTAFFSLTHLQSLFFFSNLNFNGLSLHTWHLLHVLGHVILFALTPHRFSLFAPTHEQSLGLEIKSPFGFLNLNFNVGSSHVATGGFDGEFVGDFVETGGPDGAIVATGPSLNL